MNQSLGMDIIYRLSGVTSIPFNAPLGGIYGEWAEICGTWLLHPDNIHPLSIYLREDKVTSRAKNYSCCKAIESTQKQRQNLSKCLKYTNF